MRPALKQHSLETLLRRQITGGRLPPGGRLPTQVEIEQTFQVSNFTVQRALDRLIGDGFIEARGRQGTFVVDHPPHLFRHALIFPSSPTDGGWMRYWTALANEAVAHSALAHRTIGIYHGVDGHTDVPDFRRLLADIHGERLAGLIFAAPPFGLAGTPILDHADLPRVALTKPQEAFRFPVVDLDGESFTSQALDHFQARGRRRIAVLSVRGTAPDARFAAALSARGLATRPWWCQVLSQTVPEGANAWAQLLMRGHGAERPDGLLITDDNLVEHAVAGLIAAGMSIPADLEVVGHCNFPWPTPSSVPIRRLGYDARHLLETCIASIDRQRRGEQPPPVTRVQARFESDVRP